MLKGKKLIVFVHIIVFLTILIVLSILRSSFIQDNFVVNSEKEADKRKADYIQYSLSKYLRDSGDWELSFGRESAENISVEDIILKLQGAISYKGQNYGPYLDGYKDKPDLQKYLPNWNESIGGKYSGWEVIISKDSKEIKVIPSESGDKLILWD